jgi:hypothetical protein
MMEFMKQSLRSSPKHPHTPIVGATTMYLIESLSNGGGGSSWYLLFDFTQCDDSIKIRPILIKKTHLSQPSSSLWSPICPASTAE